MNKIKEWWAGVKAWFKHSETIFIARLTALVGAVTSTVTAVDWAPLVNFGMSPGFTWKQAMAIGLSLLFGGVMLELARRRNANM